ncbi:MAG: TIR domain-containing protein [Pseudomonadota bacterium]
MNHIFISYARTDGPIAEGVSDALRAAGHEVWRDDQLPAHRAYSEVIEERLKTAKAVIVLWSAEAAQSQWVRAEADTARTAGTLIQASIDGTVPPLPFNQIQCADLKGWEGEVSAPGWRKVEASVAALAGSPKPSAKPPPRSRSICVLPFANMSGEAEQEYFSDGISEDITTDLSKVSALSVVARNTAFQFKGKAVDVGEVAGKLGVSHVLEGSVRKAGGRVRITAQLINGETGDHVWAERYDRDLTDIFAIQDEISQAIVHALKLQLLPEERQAIENRGTDNPDAYNLLLMARQAWVTGTHGDIRREDSVIRMCDRIIELEPDYGRAWALKALAQCSLFFGYNKGKDNGVEAANRALRLDPSLPEPYCVMARAAADERDFDEAERQTAIAVRLGPDLWEAHNEAGATFIWQRKFREAVPHYEKCLELLEDDRHSCDMLSMAYRALDDCAGTERIANKMLKLAQRAIDKNPGDCAAFGIGANALVMLGDMPRAMEWFDRSLLIDPDNLNIRYNFACSLIGYSTDVTAALDQIDYIFARSVGSIVRRADLDTDLDPVRDHPRFQAIYAAALERIAKYDAEQAATPAASAERPRS